MKQKDKVHAIRVWEKTEIILLSQQTHENPYADVICWVDLVGPDFKTRVYGFWDGNQTYRVRVVATKPGLWRWTSGSNQSGDAGLNGGAGEFTAIEWQNDELEENPNRRGFVRSTTNGHALQYADGTPFFLLSDTWLAASTWRMPYGSGRRPSPDYEPGPGITFEDVVGFRKRQGFNAIGMISAFPNNGADSYSSIRLDDKGVCIRAAWQKWGHYATDGELTSKDMHDEHGNRPFAMHTDMDGVADFDSINPAYFQSLDRKMQHLSEEGFVPFIEPVRRDQCVTWKVYFDFKVSYARYVQYLVSRYGAYNVIFSGIHLDHVSEEIGLTGATFNKALVYRLNTYGPPPFGQPMSSLIDCTTLETFGHGEECPWLTMHSVGNNPRYNSIMEKLEDIFRLEKPYPAANLEPYFTGWMISPLNLPAGERPPRNSERDNGFSRAVAYGSVLSGGLAGHQHGTDGYDCTTTGETAGPRAYIWEALKYESGNQMRHLKAFMLSEGSRYQNLELATDRLAPNKAPGCTEDGLDGWSFAMSTPDKSFALLYFQPKSLQAKLSGMYAGTTYAMQWFDPRTGRWLPGITIESDANGQLTLPVFPGRLGTAQADWAAKILLK